MGHGYSYEIIRAETLYSKHAIRVGSCVQPDLTSAGTKTIEYGPHIPTLVQTAEGGDGFNAR